MTCWPSPLNRGERQRSIQVISPHCLWTLLPFPCYLNIPQPLRVNQVPAESREAPNVIHGGRATMDLSLENISPWSQKILMVAIIKGLWTDPLKGRGGVVLDGLPPPPPPRSRLGFWEQRHLVGNTFLPHAHTEIKSLCRDLLETFHQFSLATLCRLRSQKTVEIVN